MKWKRWKDEPPTRADASKYGRVFVLDISDDYTGVRKWNEPLPERELYWTSFNEQRQAMTCREATKNSATPSTSTPSGSG